MLKAASSGSCEAAVKILMYQGIRVCGDTLLNMVKKAGKEYKCEAGKNIGIDDWAYRRGREYGTLICDLDTHKIIEVLEGRDSATVKKWLANHPDIEIVSRDRSSEYATAVQAVLPEAVQIADRFHITKNLLDALNETLKGFMPEVIKIPVESAEETQRESDELDENEEPADFKKNPGMRAGFVSRLGKRKYVCGENGRELQTAQPVQSTNI
jgi:transposase